MQNFVCSNAMPKTWSIPPKPLLIMKLTIVLLTVATLHVSATGYAQKVSISEQDVTLEKIFKAIKKQTGYGFFYEKSLLENSHRQSVNVKNVSINEALDSCLKGQGLTYEIIDRTIAIRRKAIEKEKPSEPAPPIVLKGTVRDAEGNPLAGVSVKVKGTNIGVATDNNGNYSIESPKSGVVLVFSYVGFIEKEVAASDNTVLNVKLQPKPQQMDSIVVIAYGTSSRRTVSNAITTVTAKDFEDKPVTNALQAVQGLMPGVNIQQGTGAPGDAPQIKVRGMGSLGAGNEPLYVVDGVPLSDASAFNQINPADIQSMDILKDAAAAAMYGSRGGNGVVLVTTKRGTKGAPKFDFSVSYGMQELSKKIKVLNKEQYVEYVKDAFTNASRPVPSIYNSPDSLANTDWQNQIFNKAPMVNYQLSASGASDKVGYFVSGNYVVQDGILKNSGYSRYSFRSKIDVDLKPWLKMGVNLAPSYANTDVQPSHGAVNGGQYTATFGMNPSPSIGSPITLALLTPPVIPVFLSNGDYASNYNWPATTPGNIGTMQAFNGQHYNPVQILDLYKDKYKSFKFIGNSFLQAEPLKGLKLKTSLGGEYRSDDRLWTVPATLAYDNNTLANLSNPITGNIQSALSKGYRYSLIWENTANYSTSVKEHKIDAVVGYAAQQTKSEATAIFSRVGTATNQTIQYPSNTTQLNGAILPYGENTLASIFGRVQYSYRYKYMLSVAMRRDGSSRFGPNNRYATFPSASAAWAIDEEEFFKRLISARSISLLKLRASWGLTGNYNIGDFSWQGQMSLASYAFGSGQGTINPGYGQSSFDLADLTWESNEQTDIGLDVGLMNNRIQVVADYYVRTTKNLLLNANLPALVGFATTIRQNVGSIQNKGFEIAVSSQNFVGKFKWNTKANLSFNRNKILSLLGDQPIYANILGVAGYQNSIRSVVGGSLGDFYGLKQIGVYMNDEDLANSAKWTGAQPSGVGDIKYSDENKDGKIDVADIIKIGTPHPKFIYGLTNSFNYANFDLNIILQGVYGGDIVNAVVRYSNTFLGGDNPFIHTLDRWRSVDNPGNGWVPKAKAWSGTANPAPLAQFSTYNLYSASYLRISTITLGYNLTKAMFRKKSDKSLRLYVAGQNLFTFTKYAGYNPDANMYGGEDSDRLGIDQGAYPLARTITVGLNMRF